MEHFELSMLKEPASLAVAVGFIWYLLKRYMKKFDDMATVQSKMATDLAVIQTQILSAVSVAMDVKEHQDKITRLEVRSEHLEKDINALHQKNRERMAKR